MVLGLLQCLASTSCRQLSVTSFAWRERIERERERLGCLFYSNGSLEGKGEEDVAGGKGKWLFPDFVMVLRQM